MDMVVKHFSASTSDGKSEARQRNRLKNETFSSPPERRVVVYRASDPTYGTVDQVAALFSRASVVIGPHGAGLADVVFCRPGTVMVELYPAEMLQADLPFAHYWSIAADLDLHYIAFPVEGSGYTGPMLLGQKDLAVLDHGLAVIAAG